MADHPTIKKGSKGDAVKLAQKRLVMRFYDPARSTACSAPRPRRPSSGTRETGC